MSTDIERLDIVEQARAALSDWHEACARMDEVDADPDLGHEDRRVRRDKALTIAEVNDGMDVLARAIGYAPSDFPGSTWPHLDSIGQHTLGSLAVEAAGHIDRARDLAARLETDGARLIERIEALIEQRLAEVGLRPTPYAAGVRNCSRSVLDILAEHRAGDGA
jgi:hypothetical protein